MRETLRALVHQVKLNERGWPDKVLQAWIETAFFYKDGYTFSSINELAEFLKREFGRSFSEPELRKSLDTLTNRGIVRIPTGWKLSEQRIQEIDKRLRESEVLESAVRDQWIAELQARYPQLAQETLHKLWKELIEGFIGPLFLKYGAEAMYLITGAKHLVSEEISVTLRKLLNSCASKLTSLQLEGLVTQEFPDFLLPRTPQRRQYLINLMESALAHHAVGLDKKTLDKIYTMPINMNLFLDTNFLFSILDLHENPLNETAKALITIAQKVGGKVTIKFYVTDRTLREFQENIRWARTELSRYRWTRELSAAAVRAGELPGLVLMYLKHNLEKPVSPDTYFEPYEAAIQLFRSKGIELYNEKFDRLRLDQAVIDDIHDYRDYLKSRGKPREWDPVEHDVMLWHLVRERRPAVDSPLEARLFILTCDFRFCGFDARKRKQLGFDTPICLLPGHLLQMIRYFVPRTDDFDAAFLQSLRMPILSPFDVERENTTLQILEALARIKEISEDENTAYAVLTDQALRRALTEATYEQEQLLAVVESVATRKLQESLQEREKELQSKAQELEKLSESKLQETKHKESLEQALAQLSDQLRHKDAELTYLKTREEQLEKIVVDLNERLRQQEQEAERKQKQGDTWQTIVITVLSLMISTAIPYLIVTATPLPTLLGFVSPWAYYTIAYIFTLAILQWKVWPRFFRHYPQLQKCLGRVLKWLLLCGAILQTVEVLSRFFTTK